MLVIVSDNQIQMKNCDDIVSWSRYPEASALCTKCIRGGKLRATSVLDSISSTFVSISEGADNFERYVTLKYRSCVFMDHSHWRYRWFPDSWNVPMESA